MLIGIDPGIGGALVLLDGNCQPLEWSEMPTMKVGKNSRVNAAALAALLSQWHLGIARATSHAYVELTGAMPGQGVTSMFAFGHANGVIAGCLAGAGIPHTLVSPQTWKKRADLLGKDKDAARTRAIQLWPQWRSLDPKGKGQALADAALIARYGAFA